MLARHGLFQPKCKVLQIIPATQLYSIPLTGGLCGGFALVLVAWQVCNHPKGNILGKKTGVDTTNWVDSLLTTNLEEEPKTHPVSTSSATTSLFQVYWHFGSFQAKCRICWHESGCEPGTMKQHKFFVAKNECSTQTR